jgi:glutathione peroxidase-family protein
MAFDQTRRIRPIIVTEDCNAFTALKQLPGYSSTIADYTVEQIEEAYEAMQKARAAEIKAQNELEAVRVDVTRAEWNFHNAMLGAKKQVVAHYGEDSTAVSALGLTRKSERRRPVRRALTTKE